MGERETTLPWPLERLLGTIGDLLDILDPPRDSNNNTSQSEYQPPQLGPGVQSPPSSRNIPQTEER